MQVREEVAEICWDKRYLNEEVARRKGGSVKRWLRKDLPWEMGSSTKKDSLILAFVHPFVFVRSLIHTFINALIESFIHRFTDCFAGCFIHSVIHVISFNFISIVRSAVRAPLILSCHWFYVITLSYQQPKWTICSSLMHLTTSIFLASASRRHSYTAFSFRNPHWRGRALLVNPINYRYMWTINPIDPYA